MTDAPVRIEPQHSSGSRPLELGRVPAQLDLGIRNNTYIALLIFVPIVGLVMPFVLGAKGGRWAWRNGRWDSVRHFTRVKRNGRFGARDPRRLFAPFRRNIRRHFLRLQTFAAYELGAEKLARPRWPPMFSAPRSQLGFPFGSITSAADTAPRFSLFGHRPERLRPGSSGRGQEERRVVDQKNDAQAQWEQSGD